jgi:hypothetical protein
VIKVNRDAEAELSFRLDRDVHLRGSDLLL